ncbi:enterochelin esterase [Actinoplanes sp. NPDC051851]|uniref:enterochelin esterase n=1 Tax=Actinoplanes sp. NPDC051851 TaxID=3154753 RepID=UPI00341490F0
MSSNRTVPASSVPPRIPRPWPAPLAESPRIAALTPEGVGEFWAEVERDGAPLIEKDGAEGALLTFVWRDRAPTRDVLVLVNKLADRSRLEQSRMRRLAGTDLWHLTYRVRDDWQGSYQFAPDESVTAPSVTDAAHWRRVAMNLVADPLNPEILAQTRPPHRSVAAAPGASAGPRWWQPSAGVPAGTVDVVETPRRVWRYTPPGYRADGDPYPLLVLLDGDVWGPLLPVAPILDNLIAAGRIPPLVALMPDSVDRPTRFTEYACDPSFVSFLAGPLIASTGLNVTDDPARTVIAGQSLGGLTAAFAGLTRPDRFGNVLSQSGAFWWQSNSPDDVDAEWFSQQVALIERQPVRWRVEVGLDEWVNLLPSRHLRDVLRARGYRLDYTEFAGGHDRLCWRDRFGDALASLLGD